MALARAAEIFAKAGREAVLVPTTGPGTAGALARVAAEGGAALIVAAGGDGTLNEVLQGMVGSAVPLAILPGGTANVLANEMGVPGTIERAAAALAGYRPYRIAAGRVRRGDGSQRHFLLMAGAGLDARIVYEVSGPLKDRVGKLAYWVAGMRTAGRRLEEFPVTVDGQSTSCSFALVSRVRNYGGDLQIACETSLFDDRFEVVLFAGRNTLRYLKYLAGVALRRVAGMRGVTVLRARQVALGAAADRRVYLQVDGEFAGPLPAVIEMAPDAVTLLVPPEYAARRGDGP
jgi:YegS/Rv2252/BmrU family lipid kinase